MHPSPRAETRGPFFPSWRCGIHFSSLSLSFIELDEKLARSVTNYGTGTMSHPSLQ